MRIIIFLILWLPLQSLALNTSFHLTIPIQQMSVIPTYIYSQPNIRSKKIREVKFREILNTQNLAIYQQQPWWRLRLKTGNIGYIRARDFADSYQLPKSKSSKLFNPYLMGLTNTIALLLLNPEITDLDYKIAIPYLNEALSSQYPTAYWLKGVMQRDGLGLEKDIDQAILNLLRASNNGEDRAYYDLAMVFDNKELSLYDPIKALRLCRSGAERGDPRAKDWLTLYDTNEQSHISRSSQVLLDQMLIKANEKDTKAMRFVAALYRSGQGAIAVDEKKAEQWLKKAAILGDTQAMIELASLYFTGTQELLPNNVRSIHWYQQAAKNNNPKGQYLYGNALYYGLGTQANQDIGIYWLRQAAENGYSKAIHDLALLEPTDQ